MNEENEAMKEQVKGLYIVGLLAVLVTIRLTVKVEDSLTNQFLFYVITSWATYSFCMIFAYSNLKPKNLMTFFKELAELFLYISLFVSIGYFAIISYIVFTVFPFAIVLYILFAFAMALIHYAKKKRLPRKSSEEEKTTDKT